MRRKVCFFNFWHNGDIFNCKGYVQAVMRAYPGLDYAYALGVHPELVKSPLLEKAAGTKTDAIKDLRCQIVTCDQLPDGLGWFDKFAVSDEWQFVNTWIGAYAEEVFLPGEEHGNYPNLQRMWALVYKRLNEDLALNLQISHNVWDAVPTTDWSVYNREAADRFVQLRPCVKRLMFCNGPANSFQSAWAEDDMHRVIEELAVQHPDWSLVCTRRFDTAVSNIAFTDDIFRQECDINEIGYLSMWCDLIWGKNSGPYVYCHVRENLFNPATIFFSASDRPSDSLPYGCDDIVCRYYHSLTGDTATMVDQINGVMRESAGPSEPGPMVVLQ